MKDKKKYKIKQKEVACFLLKELVCRMADRQKSLEEMFEDKDLKSKEKMELCKEASKSNMRLVMYIVDVMDKIESKGGTIKYKKPLDEISFKELLDIFKVDYKKYEPKEEDEEVEMTLESIGSFEASDKDNIEEIIEEGIAAVIKAMIDKEDK